jgi:hypothetical protein
VSQRCRAKRVDHSFRHGDQATRSAEALLAKLGISKRKIRDLQKLSRQEILDAQSSLDVSARR